MKKIAVVLVLAGGLTAVAFASFKSVNKKETAKEKKMEKKEKKKECRRTCLFS